MSNKKTHWKQTTDRTYLGSHDFEENETKIGTIKNIDQSRKVFNPSSNEEETCFVVEFKQKGLKPMILNTTNKQAIEKAAGSPYIEDWKGKHVELFTIKDKFFGEMMRAVRIRHKAPKMEKPKLTPTSKRWKGAVENLKSGKVDMKTLRNYFQISDKIEKRLKEAISE